MRARALLLVALVTLGCREEQERQQREAALKAALAQIRVAIGTYKAEHQGHYPGTLEELVPRYLRAIPVDPITHLPDWRLTTEETVQPSTDFQTTTAEAPPSVIIDVRSNAPGTDARGVAYANY